MHSFSLSCNVMINELQFPISVDEDVVLVHIIIVKCYPIKCNYRLRELLPMLDVNWRWDNSHIFSPLNLIQFSHRCTTMLYEQHTQLFRSIISIECRCIGLKWCAFDFGIYLSFVIKTL